MQWLEKLEVDGAGYQDAIEAAREPPFPAEEASGFPQVLAGPARDDARHGGVIGPVHLLPVDDPGAGARVRVLGHHQLFHVDEVEAGGAETPGERVRESRAPEVGRGVGQPLEVFRIVLGGARSGRRVDGKRRAQAREVLARHGAAGFCGVADGEDLHGGESGKRSDQAEVPVVAAVLGRKGDVGTEKERPHPRRTPARISSSALPPVGLGAAAR